MPFRTTPKPAGRPPRAVLDAVRVKLWVNKVEELSQLTPAQLDLRYAPAGEGGKGQRMCLWHKYRKGLTSPRDGGWDDTTSLVALIDCDFPGTAYWFRHPFWSLARNKVNTMEELGSLYAHLGEKVRDLLVLKPAERFTPYFWRTATPPLEICQLLKSDTSLDAGAAILGLVNESYISLQFQTFHKTKAEFRLWVQRVNRHGHLSPIALYCHPRVAATAWLWDVLV